MIKIGETIKYLRELHGLSQRDAASKLAISNVHLCNVENDKSVPSPELIDRCRELWSVDIYVLTWCMRGEVDKLPPSIRKPMKALAAAWHQELRRKRILKVRS